MSLNSNTVAQNLGRLNRDQVWLIRCGLTMSGIPNSTFTSRRLDVSIATLLNNFMLRARFEIVSDGLNRFDVKSWSYQSNCRKSSSGLSCVRMLRVFRAATTDNSSSVSFLPGKTGLFNNCRLFWRKYLSNPHPRILGFGYRSSQSYRTGSPGACRDS